MALIKMFMREGHLSSHLNDKLRLKFLHAESHGRWGGDGSPFIPAAPSQHTNWPETLPRTPLCGYGREDDAERLCCVPQK